MYPVSHFAAADRAAVIGARARVIDAKSNPRFSANLPEHSLVSPWMRTPKDCSARPSARHPDRPRNPATPLTIRRSARDGVQLRGGAADRRAARAAFTRAGAKGCQVVRAGGVVLAAGARWTGPRGRGGVVDAPAVADASHANVVAPRRDSPLGPRGALGVGVELAQDRPLFAVVELHGTTVGRGFEATGPKVASIELAAGGS